MNKKIIEKAREEILNMKIMEMENEDNMQAIWDLERAITDIITVRKNTRGFKY